MRNDEIECEIESMRVIKSEHKSERGWGSTEIREEESEACEKRVRVSVSEIHVRV
jgi:hypothetical protein